VNLADEEVEESLELVRVPAQARRNPAGSIPSAGSSVRTSTWSSLRKRSTRPSTRTASPGLEAPVEQLDVVPDSRADPAARVDELQGEIRRAVLRPQPLLPRDGVNPLNGAVFLELRDRRHREEFRTAG
jgi:hypothetical protein